MSLYLLRALPRAAAATPSSTAAHPSLAVFSTNPTTSFSTLSARSRAPASRFPAALCVLTRARSDVAASESSEITISKPTMADAKAMPRFYSEFSNETLAVMAAQGEQGAREERLIREIMVVDNVTWDEAQPTFQAMSRDNKVGMTLAKVPYSIGIMTAVTAAAASFPLCFHYDLVMWFNEVYVTADVPEPKDLETWLEVGSWAWNWMEPPLGQISFVLLCLGYARSQMQNLGAKPFTGWLLHRRADRLCNAYPKYNKKIVTDFSTTDGWH